jgi:hypothetical protein
MFQCIQRALLRSTLRGFVAIAAARLDPAELEASSHYHPHSLFVDKGERRDDVMSYQDITWSQTEQLRMPTLQSPTSGPGCLFYETIVIKRVMGNSAPKVAPREEADIWIVYCGG